MIEYSILSARKLYPFPVMGAIVELENVLKSCLGANLILLEDNGYIDNKITSSKADKILIVCNVSLSQVVNVIKKIGNNIDIFDQVVVYITDAFTNDGLANTPSWRKKISSFYRTLDKVDHLFIPYKDSMSYYQENLSVNTYYLPVATDVLKYGGCNIERPIELIGYGRIYKPHSDIFSDYFNKNNNGVFMHTDHSILSEITDFTRYRDYFWNILRNTKISLAYDPVKADPKNKFKFSFVAMRWFEAMAAGCVILGYRPTSDDTDTLLSWKDSTVEIPENPQEALEFVNHFVLKKDAIHEIGMRNYVESLRTNDWRYRVYDVINILGLSIPSSLDDEITKIKNKIERTAI